MNDFEYTATAIAHPNIAIAKYWGKRDESLNLPLFDSVSFGVNGLETRTTASWSDDIPDDALYINDCQVPPSRMERMLRIIQTVRKLKGWAKKCEIHSHNNFAHSSGLASSASGAAGAAVAVSCAAGVVLSQTELSALARLGSGSAARSIHAGWTRWHAGHLDDGSDSYAEPFAPSDYWPLNVFIVQISNEPKAVSSTECMKRCMHSPLWDAYCAEVSSAAERVQHAVINRDFDDFAAASHHNAMLLHALTMSCPQPVCYFAPKTIALIQKIFAMRATMPVCCTLDAGPNVVILCEDIACSYVSNEIAALDVPFVQTTIGGGTSLADCVVWGYP